jgi:nicotinate-nucleotide adenylyltransferase
VGRLGIFGGTFDPPHIAHQALAAEAMLQLKLDRVLWVLTPYPPHKLGAVITPLEFRLEMVQAAIDCEPDYELSTVDIDRPPPHYALDTVRILGDEHPDDELVYLMGGDSLRDLPTWHLPQDFVAACHALGVMRRPRARFDLANLERLIPGLSVKLCFFTAPRLSISASDIRRRVRQGLPYRYMIPEGVRRVILEKRLYSRLSS